MPPLPPPSRSLFISIPPASGGRHPSHLRRPAAGRGASAPGTRRSAPRPGACRGRVRRRGRPGRRRPAAGRPRPGPSAARRPAPGHAPSRSTPGPGRACCAGRAGPVRRSPAPTPGAVPSAGADGPGPVPGDGRGPAPEPGAVAPEPAQVPGDLQPGVGRHVLRVVPDQPAQVPEQSRLHQPVRHREGGLVTFLSPRDGRAQLPVVRVHAAGFPSLAQELSSSVPVRGESVPRGAATLAHAPPRSTAPGLTEVSQGGRDTTLAAHRESQRRRDEARTSAQPHPRNGIRCARPS